MSRDSGGRFSHTSRPLPPITREEIKHLTYREVIRILSQAGISTEGLFDVEQAREFLHFYFYGDNDDSHENLHNEELQNQLWLLLHRNNNLSNICDSLNRRSVINSDLQDSDERKKYDEQCLQDGLAVINSMMDSIFTRVTPNLGRSDWKNKLDLVKARLKPPLAQVLFLGIESSGKSSLINLLAGKEVLPVDRLNRKHSRCIFKICNTTSMVSMHVQKSKLCSRDGKAQIEFITKELPLQTQNISLQVRDILTSSIFSSQNPRDEITVSCPIQFLGDSSTFLEIPSLALSELTILDEYLRSAAAVVFVLTSCDSQRLFNPEVKRLIERVRRTYDAITMTNPDVPDGGAMNQCVSARSVIFVFNHWDGILSQFRDKAFNLQERYLAQLRTLWPKVELDYNVFFASASHTLSSKALDAVNLKNAICNLLMRSVSTHHDTAFRWLEYAINSMEKETQKRLTEAVNAADKDESERRKLFTLMNKQPEMSEVKEELKLQIDNELQLLRDDLSGFLHSSEGLAIIKEFDEDEIPNVERVEDLMVELDKLFSKQIQKMITNWNQGDIGSVRLEDIVRDSECQIFENENFEFETTERVAKVDQFFDRLIKLCFRKFKEIEQETQILSESLKEGSVSLDEKADVDGSPMLNNLEVVVLGLTSIIWFPLAVVGAAIISPILLCRFGLNVSNAKDRFTDYQNNPRRFIETEIEQFIPVYGLQIMDNVLEPVHQNCEKLKAALEDIGRKFCEMMEYKITNLNTNSSLTRLNKMFRPILTHTHSNLDAIYDHYYRYVKVYEYRIEQLNFHEAYSRMSTGISANLENQEQIYIRRGSFLNDPQSARLAHVHESTWKTLSHTNHRNILRFYGLIDLEDSVGFVSEHFDGNLRQLIDMHFDRSFLTRSHGAEWTKRSTSKDVIMSCAYQLVAAMRFVHQRSLILQGLCPENIMFIRNRELHFQIKLFSFGLPDTPWEPSYWDDDSLYYVSPETHKQNIYNAKSNIFTLGLILWELSHHKRFYKQRSLTSAMETNLENDLDVLDLVRADEVYEKLLNTSIPVIQTPEYYQESMLQCLHWNPDERPTTEALLTIFNDSSTFSSVRRR